MDEKMLQNWLKKRSGDELPTKLSAEERAELARYDRLWEAAAPPAPPLEVDTQAAWEKVDARLFGEESKVVPLAARRGGQLRWITYLRVAAALLLLAVLAFQIRAYLAERGAGEVLAFAAAETPTEFMLPDGSQIYLNAHSELTYAGTATERRVTLSGEAFFDVYRDAEQPFTILTGELTTTVLGTSFNVRAYPGETSEVSVKTGTVKVAVADEAVILVADEQVAYQPATKQLTPKKAAVVDAEAWRTRELKFDGALLRDVIPVLENYYGTRIVVENEALLNCPENGTYIDQDLSAVLDLFAFKYAAEIEQSADGVVIRGGVCE